MNWTDMRLKRKSQTCFKTRSCAGEFAAKVGALGAAITRAQVDAKMRRMGQKPLRLHDWVYHCGGKEFGIHWYLVFNSEIESGQLEFCIFWVATCSLFRISVENRLALFDRSLATLFGAEQKHLATLL